MYLVHHQLQHLFLALCQHLVKFVPVPVRLLNLLHNVLVQFDNEFVEKLCLEVNQQKIELEVKYHEAINI